MKKTVLIYGLLSGVVSIALFATTSLSTGKIDMERGTYFGFASIILAGILISFGIASYKQSQGGRISFGRAFKVGVLTAIVSSTVYVTTWMVLYRTSFSDFGSAYAKHSVEQARKSGKSEAEIKVMSDKINADMKMYDENAVYRAAVTYMEPLPVQIIIVLIASIILSRKKKEAVIERD